MVKLSENQEKWLQALESGKYERIWGQLYDGDNKMSCLGVACEVSGLDNWDGDTYLGEFHSIPYAVFEWLEIYESAIEALNDMNDEYCNTFEVIAKYVRENPYEYFQQLSECVINENIEKWLKALDSGKYTKSQGPLRQTGKIMSHLGVACDVSKISRWDGNFYMGEYSRPPQAVIDWLGLHEGGVQWVLSSNNGWSFTDIATEIRTYPEEYIKLTPKEQ